ncbi:hypothetical protein MTO96_036269 [Rhipicephalus appendiculatus]
MSELSRRVIFYYAQCNQELPRNTALDANATVEALIQHIRIKGLRPLLTIQEYQKDVRTDEPVMVDYTDAVALFENCIYPSPRENSELSRHKKIIELLMAQFPSTVWTHPHDAEATASGIYRKFAQQYMNSTATNPKISATGGGKVGGVHGRVLDILESTGTVVAAAPECYPIPDETHQCNQCATSRNRHHSPDLPQPQPGPLQPKPRQRQPLDEAVSRAVAEYERQSQSADRRALADWKFHRKLLEQNRCHHEAQIASQGRLENQLGRLTEEVGRLCLVQQQRLDQERRAQKSTQRLLQQLPEALASGAALVA